MIRLAPGDPVEKILGQAADQIEIEKYRSQLGLDLPFWNQYLDYIKSLVVFDLGESLFKKKNVSTLIKEYFPPSFILAILSILSSFLIGSMLGVILAINRGSFFDFSIRIASLLGLAFPIFSLAPLLVLIFAIELNILPVSEWGKFRHLILPTITLTIPMSAILSRVVRNRFLDDLQEPWVQVLASKGLSKGAIWIRVFKVTLPTILNVVAIQLSVVLAGTIITETIYDIPGIGLLLFEAIQNRDYPLVQGVIVFTTIIYLSIYFLIDFINQIIDPRIVK